MDSGTKSLPYFQLILTLMSDLSGNSDKDKSLLNVIISGLRGLMSDWSETEKTKILVRSPINEIKLVAIKTIIIVLSKSKFQKDSANFIVKMFINALNQFKIVEACLDLLKLLYADYWTKSTAKAPPSHQTPSNSRILNGCLLMRTNDELKYIDDMSPFFSKDGLQTQQQSTIFAPYMQILTELVIRIPYQLKKQQLHVQFASLPDWTFYLCQYLLLPPQTANAANHNNLNRLIKKLLQVLCNNSKESYRKLRDTHIINNSVNEIVVICPLDSAESELYKPIYSSAELAEPAFCNYNYLNVNNVFTYNKLIKLVDHLKVLFDIALQRTFNWQQFCLENKTIVLYLIEISLIIDEYIVSVILQLLLCAIGGTRTAQKIQNGSSSTAAPSSSKAAKPKDSKQVKDDNMGVHLTNYLFSQVDKQTLLKLMRSHLLETSNVNVRWLMHSLVYTIYKNASSANQLQLFNLIEKFW